ncbi:hypothetical protein BC827DRAFT_1225027 [Russula dissimulans]|nr:hypothetical protein BC827DRAFT_1225027 [Russula dissimulans]
MDRFNHLHSCAALAVYLARNLLGVETLCVLAYKGVACDETIKCGNCASREVRSRVPDSSRRALCGRSDEGRVWFSTWRSGECSSIC